MRHRILFIVGITLLIASTPLLWMQGREAYLSARAYDRYRVQQIEGSSTILGAHHVLVTPVCIIVDSRAFDRISPSETALLRLVDRKTDRSSAVVVERAGGRSKETWRYRIVTVDSSGETNVDAFTFDERNRKPYRVIVARFVSPQPIGFTNESLEQWPALVYPVLYPWLSAIVGAIVLLFSIRKDYAPRDLTVA